MTARLRPEERLGYRGRPFAPGYDPRRNVTGILRIGHRRKDVLVSLVECNPDLTIYLLSQLRDRNGVPVIDRLFERYTTRVERPRHLGGPRF